MTYLATPIGYFSETQNEYGKTRWLNIIPENIKWNMNEWVDITKPQNYKEGFYSVPITGILCYRHDGKEFKNEEWVYRMCKPYPFYTEEEPYYKNMFFVSYEAYNK